MSKEVKQAPMNELSKFEIRAPKPTNAVELKKKSWIVRSQKG